MEDARLKVIQNAMLGLWQENRNNSGIANVNERIILQYRTTYGLEESSEIEIGIIVRIVHPIWKHEYLNGQCAFGNHYACLD
ncbi:hypothetical protein GC096_28110 [Paenibacillus sp. LMG 31461]|uniref:Uncharacterized protein n=1 Tax=Paenibacillus plantarum TaxID=2654975 RepID=A0ABX1XJ68_9BACL|nr:hypothetical protein [Paenibacillus plantarum]NOU67895.1 hypothetical protein [Paenibacillus plantarum]